MDFNNQLGNLPLGLSMAVAIPDIRFYLSS